MPRQHRSGQTYQSPPRPAPAPVVTINQIYQFNATPAALQTKKVDQCSLEFWNEGQMSDELEDEEGNEKKKNHVVLKLQFKHRITENTPYAPEGTTGVVLNITTHGIIPASQNMGSQLRVKTIDYYGASDRTLKAVQLPVTVDMTLRHFLDQISIHELLPFVYVFNGRGYMACRDFVSQAIHQLRAAGILTLSAAQEATVHNSFNFRYAPGGLTWPNPVECGSFVGGY